MSTKQLFAIFDQLKKYGTNEVSFCGGEPTLRGDLPELVSYAKRCGFFVSMATNGYLMNEDLAEKLVQSRIDGITFSIDSASPDVHDYVRGLQGSWRKVTEGLAFVSYFRKKYGSSIGIRVNAVISKVNFKSLSTILDMKTFLDFDSVNFSPLQECVGSGLELTGDDVMYFNKYAAPEIEEKARIHRVQANSFPFGKKEVITNQNERPISAYKSTYCFVPWIYIDIMPNGDVIPCAYAGPDMVFGNLLQQPFSEVWNGKKYIAFRRRCRPPSFQMCTRCWCNLNVNMNMMQRYRQVPRRLREILEFMS